MIALVCKPDQYLMRCFSSGPVLQSPLTVFMSSQCSEPSLIPSSDLKNWPDSGSKKRMLYSAPHVLLESGRSSFRPESGQNGLQLKQMFELKFEVMANTRGQIEAHLIYSDIQFITKSK